jgi:hypothetical protein
VDTFHVVPIVIIAVAAFTLLRTVVKMVREQSFSRGALAASGEVTDVREYRRQRSRSGDRMGTYTVVTYAPVVRFPLPDGRVVDAEVYEESSRAPAPGAQVAIRYDADDPTRCRLDGGGFGRWGTHVSSLVFSVFMIAVAGSILWLTRGV